MMWKKEPPVDIYICKFIKAKGLFSSEMEDDSVCATSYANSVANSQYQGL